MDEIMNPHMILTILLGVAKTFERYNLIQTIILKSVTKQKIESDKTTVVLSTKVRFTLHCVNNTVVLILELLNV